MHVVYTNVMELFPLAEERRYWTPIEDWESQPDTTGRPLVMVVSVGCNNPSNSSMKLQLKLFAVAGLLAVSAVLSQAQTYYVAGPAGNWSATAYGPMTAGPNSGEYSLTITGTVDTYDQCKVTDGTWDNSWPSDNLEFLYDSTGSATIHFWPGTFNDGWQPTANRVGYDDPDTDPGWSLAGTFNNWGAATNLTGLGSGVYSNTVVDTYDTPPGPMEFKFQSPQDSWSDINFGVDFGNGGGNGSAPLANSNQSLPVVLDLPDGRYYVGAPQVPSTSSVTFQVDMTVPILLGNFTNGNPNNTVSVTGSFADWSNGLLMTNNPTLSGQASNVYVCVVPDVSFGEITYRFNINGTSGTGPIPLSSESKYRTADITNSIQVLPVVYYDDLSIYDYVITPTLVKFSLYITNGTPDVYGYCFQKGSDSLFVIYPIPSGPWPWCIPCFPSFPELYEVGNSDVYTNSILIPSGSSISLSYQYGMDESNDENGYGANHVREIRNAGPTYDLPQDVWSCTVLRPGNGNPYPNPGIASTNIVEPDYGYLKIGQPSGGTIPITWLGRPGVFLENASDLTNGSWNINPGTSATQSTNWPVSGDAQFFRLKKTTPQPGTGLILP